VLKRGVHRQLWTGC